MNCVTENSGTSNSATLKDSTIIVRHKAVPHYYSATLTSTLINSTNSKSVPWNTEALK